MRDSPISNDDCFSRKPNPVAMACLSRLVQRVAHQVIPQQPHHSQNTDLEKYRPNLGVIPKGCF